MERTVRMHTDPPAAAADGDRESGLQILWSTPTETSVVRKSLILRKRGFNDRSSPSASLPSRDILFRGPRRRPEWRRCGPSGTFIRTIGACAQAHFEPFLCSPGALSLTQPNLGDFGTDLKTYGIQKVAESSASVRFEERLIRRSERGSNWLVQYGMSPGGARLTKPAATKLRAAQLPDRGHPSQLHASFDVYCRTAGVSTGRPLLRQARYSSRLTSSFEPGSSGVALTRA